TSRRIAEIAGNQGRHVALFGSSDVPLIPSEQVCGKNIGHRSLSYMPFSFVYVAVG
ncbi:hypothetical protein EG68_11689, partial [Paragonimus skrjabini miyazakii]